MTKQTTNTVCAAAAALFVAILAGCGGGQTIPQPAAGQTNAAQPLVTTQSLHYRLVLLPSGLIPEAINDTETVVGFDGTTGHGFEYQLGRVTELPVLPGDSSGDARDINNRGQIVGYSVGENDVVPCFESVCPVQHAVSYRSGQPVYLGAIAGSAVTPTIVDVADRINDAGEIVGESGFPHDLAKLSQLVIFKSGSAQSLTFDGFLVYGQPLGLNNSGEIVGVAETIWAGSPSGSFAFPNSISCSPPLSIPEGAIFGINDAGDVIAASGDAIVSCRHGVSLPVPLYPSDVNNRGDIIGFATVPQSMVLARGKLHSAQSGTRLGNFFVSADRTVKGVLVSINYGDAVLYSNGRLFDLNDIVPNHPGMVIQTPVAMNNRGDIVGYSLAPDGLSLIGYLLVRQ